MTVRIFLSGVSNEFAAYRDQLRHDLTRHNVEVKIQEDFKDYGGVTLEKLDLYITACDAVVHLVGNMSGSEPATSIPILTKYPDLVDKVPPLREPLENGLGISYTQWEAWLAIYHGKPLLIAEANDDAPRGPDYAPTEASRSAQKKHLSLLKSGERYPGFTFTSPDNLAKQIAYTTILDLLAKEQPQVSSAGDVVIISGHGNQVTVYLAAGVARAVNVPEPAAPETSLGANPYRGLAAFFEEDAKRFFGRDKQIARLWDAFRAVQNRRREWRHRASCRSWDLRAAEKARWCAPASCRRLRAMPYQPSRRRGSWSSRQQRIHWRPGADFGAGCHR